MKKILGTLLIVASLSCKKDNNFQQSKTDLITNRAWDIVFRGYDTNEDGSFEIDSFTENFLADCQLDDTFKFEKNGTYTMHPNTNTNGCGDGGYTSTWKLHANGIQFSFDTYEGEIITLNDSVFHFKIILEDSSENHLIFER